jgi:C4-dicarboxylate-specific signal transduction histidine kinase
MELNAAVAEHVRRLERLLDASRLVNSTLEVHELMEIALRIVRYEIPVDRCTLFVVDRKQKVLRSFIAQRVDHFEISLPIGQGLAGAVAATGEVLDTADAYNDARFTPEFDQRLGYRTNDALCMPVFSREGVLAGVLQLLNRARPLHAGDMVFLTGICTYIGLALHNAWIYHQLLESRKSEEELRLVRERLAHSEKLSAMGELVAGIIHEMKNPLSVALGQCALLRAAGESNPKIVERTDKVENSINQALKVAKNFLNFARAVGHDRVPVDLNGIIRQTVDLLAYEFRTRSVTVTLDLQQVPPARVDAGSMQQVLLNLLKNAQHAASENKNGGNVSVRSFCNKQKNVIRIEVTDDGPGISAEIQRQVFDPFFTTKTRDLGTGLGLPVSKRIVEEHSGTLTFESTPGSGTTFVIELDATPSVATADAS